MLNRISFIKSKLASKGAVAWNTERVTAWFQASLCWNWLVISFTAFVKPCSGWNDNSPPGKRLKTENALPSPERLSLDQL